MDSLTQLALGAAVGEAVAGKKAGNKAVLWGAIAGTIPDLDVIAGNFMSIVDSMAFHRSVTHSIAFAIVVSPLLGWVLKKLYKNPDVSWLRWTLLFFLGFVTHALLDCFTTWGTQMLWPFSDVRIAFKSIFVVDPLYTLPLLVCLVWLLFLPKASSRRRQLNTIGLTISTIYLLLTLFAKYQANQVFEASFKQNDMNIQKYSTRPSPLNIILWTVNAEVEDGYFLGYYSFFDDDKIINYSWYAKNHELLTQELPVTGDVEQLLELTEGWYTVEHAAEGVILNDLRFGTYSGWEKGEDNFVFSYKITENAGAVEIEEMEREISDGSEIAANLWDRISGN